MLRRFLRALLLPARPEPKVIGSVYIALALYGRRPAGGWGRRWKVKIQR